jgi:hypothetical protein
MRNDRREKDRVLRHESLSAAMFSLDKVQEACDEAKLTIERRTEYHYLIYSLMRRQTIIQWWPSSRKWMLCSNSKVYRGGVQDLIDYLRKGEWR